MSILIIFCSLKVMAFQIGYSNCQEYSIMEDVSYRLWRSYSIKRHDPFLMSTYTRTCIPFVPLFQMHMQVTFFYCARLCPTKIVVDRWQALHITPRGIGVANYCMRAIWNGFNPKTLPPMWDVFVGSRLCSETSIRLLRFSPLVTKNNLELIWLRCCISCFPTSQFSRTLRVDTT